MNEIMQGIEFIGMPTTIAIGIVALLLILQLVGEIVELFGKTAPEIIKIRKYFSRKKIEKQVESEERKRTAETLKQVQVLLNDVNNHYSADNIAKRDKWMHWVDDQSQVYDKSIAELNKKIDENNAITLDLLIDSKRNFIINFASKVVDENYPVTREQFNRAFKVHDEYDAIIKKHHLKNGEADVAYRIIKESYATHMRNHSFIEDVRGYDDQTN